MDSHEFSRRVARSWSVMNERRNPMAMARARHALLQAGLDSTVPLEPASSVTNEVWLTPTHVVRVNRRPNQRLRREAILGPSLPSEIGYPMVVAYGGRMGADYLVIGRPIRDAGDPRAAAEAIQQQIAAALNCEAPLG